MKYTECKYIQYNAFMNLYGSGKIPSMVEIPFSFNKQRHHFLQRTSLQSMADLDKILGAPTVPHFRCGCTKTEQKSSGASLNYGYHCINIKTSKSGGRPGALDCKLKNFLGCTIAMPCNLGKGYQNKHNTNHL